MSSMNSINSRSSSDSISSRLLPADSSSFAHQQRHWGLSVVSSSTELLHR